MEQMDGTGEGGAYPTVGVRRGIGETVRDIEDETARLREHLLGSDRWDAMRGAVAGLGRAGFSEASISAAVGELSEQLVADFLGGTVARRQNRGSDVIAADGRSVEVKARIASDKNKSNRQFNFRMTSARTDLGYCLTWMLLDGVPTLDQAIRVRMGLLIERWKQDEAGPYCARTTHDGL